GTVYLPSNFFRTYAYATSQVTQQGFGSVGLYANGSITLPAGQSVAMPAGGSLNLTARTIDVEGTVSVTAGTLSLNAVHTNSGSAEPTVTLGGTAMLSTRGQWVNLTPAGLSAAAQAGVPVQPVGSINGGNISITANGGVIEGGAVELSAGSVVDASGGGELAANSSLTKGNGGTISVAGIHNVDTSGTLQAYALGAGGTLKITAPSLRIADRSSGTPGELLFTPGRFAQGGFSQFSLASNLTGIDIAAG